MTEYFLVATEFGAKGQKSIRRDREFDVTTELSKIVS